MNKQQQAETAFCTPQMNAEASGPTKLEQLNAMRARIRTMANSGDQTPAFWEERNLLERGYNQLWNELYNSCPAGRQA